MHPLAGGVITPNVEASQLLFFNGDGSENVGDDVTNSSLMTPAQRTKKKAMEKLVRLKDGVRFLFKFE